MEISRLRIGNEDFLVSSMIERCPKAMMLRELVKNVLESAGHAVAGGHRVEIAPLILGNAPKLSIWNTGPGMNAGELHRMCDIASSIGKQNAMDENFGMGAKVASLPSNPYGVRYRSCRAGRVHQVVMGKRDGRYGRLLQPGPNGDTADIIDVTHEAKADGRTLDFDWTEVVLLGSRPDQDTVVDPYDGSPKLGPAWIADDLYARFFTLPAGLELILREGCNRRGGDQRFSPIGARSGQFSRYEAVSAERGVRLHYYYDAQGPEMLGQLMSDRNALQAAKSTTAIIYRGEIYDIQTPAAWAREAPVFGVPFCCRNISILIELPDDFPLLADGYRQFLRYAQNLQQHVQAREFAQLALRHRPAWLVELLQRASPDAAYIAGLQGQIGDLFRSMRVRRRWWPTHDTAPSPAKAVTRSGAPNDHTDEDEYEVAPQIVPLVAEADIQARGLEGKAARFYRETHQIFVNTTYLGFDAFRDLLEQEFAAAPDQEPVRHHAKAIAEQLVTREICRKLVFGLAKHGAWSEWEVEQATSMYALTLAADDTAALLPEARNQLQRALDAKTPSGESPRPAPRSRFELGMEILLAVRTQQLLGRGLDIEPVTYQ